MIFCVLNLYEGNTEVQWHYSAEPDPAETLNYLILSKASYQYVALTSFMSTILNISFEWTSFVIAVLVTHPYHIEIFDG